MNTTLILMLHAAATLAMTGVIWFVQIVHYPLFARVGAQEFTAYESAHARLTTWVVAPLMLIEASTAVALTFLASDRMLVWAGMVLLLLIWISTAVLQVPAHRRLERGFDAAVHRRLVRSNWLRTLAWSGRAVIALAFVIRV